MENSLQNEEGLKNGETGIPNQSAKDAGLDVKKKYVDINQEGWITATIHISQGLYNIIGFLAEVQDIVRAEIIKAMKRAQESKIVQPGFRGFKGIFKR